MRKKIGLIASGGGFILMAIALVINITLGKHWMVFFDGLLALGNLLLFFVWLRK